jgi:Mrp family chromosome partitioning ATPase
MLSASQVQRVAGAPVIAILPPLDDGSKRWLAPKQDANVRIVSAVGAALSRALRPGSTTARPDAVRSILITSSDKDGALRNRCARIFALVAADRGDRVLFADADISATENSAPQGLFDVLGGEGSLDRMVQSEPGSGVSVMAAGRPRESARDDAGKALARRMLADARRSYDLLVVDGGAIAENPRIAPLASCVDAVILVVQLGATSQRDLVASREAAARMGAAITSIILIDRTLAA